MLGASAPAILGKTTEWLRVMLAWLPFYLPHEHACLWWQSSVYHPPHICQWLLKQYHPLIWRREFVSFYISACLGMTCTTGRTSPGRCRFIRMPWPKQGEDPAVLWTLGASSVCWSALECSTWTAGATWCLNWLGLTLARQRCEHNWRTA